MTAIVTALRKGILAEDLKGMVEAAAAALEAAAKQSNTGASPRVLLIGPPALKAEASTPVAAPLDAAMAQEVCHSSAPPALNDNVYTLSRAAVNT